MGWLRLLSMAVSALRPSAVKAAVMAPAVLRGARVRYVSDGRSGSVEFLHGQRRFLMYYEFGGGGTVANIDVPTKEQWTTSTGFPIEMRSTVLEYIAARVVHDQTSFGRGRYVIHDDHISIHV